MGTCALSLRRLSPQTHAPPPPSVLVSFFRGGDNSGALSDVVSVAVAIGLVGSIGGDRVMVVRPRLVPLSELNNTCDCFTTADYSRRSPSTLQPTQKISTPDHDRHIKR